LWSCYTFYKGYQNDFLGCNHYGRFSEAKWDKGWRIAGDLVTRRSVMCAMSHTSHSKKENHDVQLVSITRRLLWATHHPILKNCEMDRYFLECDAQKLARVAHWLLQILRVFTPINIKDMPHLKKHAWTTRERWNCDLWRLPLIGGEPRLGTD